MASCPPRPKLNPAEQEALIALQRHGVEIDPRLTAAAKLDQAIDAVGGVEEMSALLDEFEQIEEEEAEGGRRDEADWTREEILADLWPRALQAARDVLDDPKAPASARTQAMKVVWEAKVEKAEKAKEPTKIVYLAAAYVPTG